MSSKGSDPDVIPPSEKDGVTYYTNKEKATILNQFYINQSTIEDNDDVPDVQELLTSINKSNTYECRRSKKYSCKIKHSKGDRP